MDTPASVTVLTSEFLQDVSGTRVMDATKYVAGITESSFPDGLDVVNIRGFQSTGRRIDGFSTFTQANYDPATIDRMEIIKGPDALLQPSGVPGGTINLVTKRPQFTFGGYLKAQVGEYDMNRVEADVTGPLAEGQFAYRIIAAAQDSKGYSQGTFHETALFSPSLTWRVSPQSQLTVRLEYFDSHGSNPEGIPLDPSVGTRSGFRTLEGVPLDFGTESSRKYAFRDSTTASGTFHFSSTVTDRLSVRLAGHVSEIDTPNSDFRLGPAATSGSRNPLNGDWEGADPSAPKNTLFNHSGTNTGAKFRYRDIQNDWAYTFTGEAVKSRTLIGFAYSYSHSNVWTNRQFLPSFDLVNGTAPDVEPTRAPLNGSSRTVLSRYQVYATESLDLFEGRVTLSGGVAHMSFTGNSGNKLAPATASTVAGQRFPGAGGKATFNYGLVVKPFRTLSLYYGHSENAVPSTNFQQVGAGTRPTFSQGKQDEFGVKVRLFEERLLASVAYYEIEQSGYAVFNPANISVPPPPFQLPDLILSREASGYEFQVTGNVTPNFSVILSYADTKNRDPNGVMLRGSPEDMAAAFLRYEFTQGALKGLSLSVGTNYSSKRAGDQASQFTSVSTPDNLIPNQPTFYVPSRTLTDVYVSYTRDVWSYRLIVHNVIDERYYSSTSRNLINVGNPRAFSGSLTWGF